MYKFKDYVFHNKNYVPFYDKYKGHVFIVVDEHPEDPSGEHVLLQSVTDNTLYTDRYVHLSDLEKV